MHPLKFIISLHPPPAPLQLRFLPLTYATSKVQQFTAHSAHSSTGAVPPINSKFQQFTAHSAHSSTGAVPPINPKFQQFTALFTRSIDFERNPLPLFATFSVKCFIKRQSQHYRRWHFYVQHNFAGLNITEVVAYIYLSG